MGPLIERSAEVSVDEPMRTSSDSKLEDRSKVGKLGRDSGHRISNTFNDKLARNENLPKLKNLFRQRPNIPPSSSDLVNSPSRKSIHKFDSRSKLDRHPNSRISCTKKRSLRTNSTGVSRDSRDVKLSRRTGEICLNNSQSTGPALGHNSNAEFSDRKAEISAGPVEVESTTEFDHVAAIKRITSTFSLENAAPPFETPSSIHVESSDNESTVPPSQGANLSIRHWSSKHSNRTKFRQPPSGQSSLRKKGQAKVSPNKIPFSRNNASVHNVQLKNWPNGAIQNVDDFQNYEKYTSFGDDPKLEQAITKPVPLKNVSLSHPVPVTSPSLQEIVHWLKIPAFMTNGSHIVESDQAGEPVSFVFDPIYENLEPNRPSKPSDVQTFKPGFIYPVHSRPSYTPGNFKLPSWLGSVLLKNKTVYNPQTQVSQNTVVHFLNTDSRKPNRTTVVAKVPGNYGQPGPSGSSSGYTSYPSSILLSQLSPSTTSKPGPNVHIGFTSYEDKNKVPESQTPVVTYDQSCPTILINSYTKINNTIQSKEGCTDLNIIINSHVFNTNMLKPTAPQAGTQPNPGSYEIYGDKYAGVSQDAFLDPGLGQAVPIYQSSSSGPSVWPQGGYYSPPKNPQGDVPLETDVPSGLSNFEVFQGTHISVSGSNSQIDPSTEVEASPPVDYSLMEVDETDLPGNSAVTEEDSSALAAASDPANDDPGLNSLVQSPGDPNASPTSASPSHSAGLAATSSSQAPSTDDEDDEYDLSPAGIMDSLASVFTYFTFVNPLHYGFFSLAAAPFTALAAGVLGIFTFLFPWVFPSSFNLGRANDDAAGSYWPNLEEIARRSMDKYGRLNEWKSRRKKRKR